jgi:septal ring factor EnvC (AmiA/AmiB activator)
MEYKLPSGTASIEMDITTHMGEVTVSHLSTRREIVVSLRESLEKNLRLTEQVRHLESTALETFHKLANERKKLAELKAKTKQIEGDDTLSILNMLESGGDDASIGEHLKSTFTEEQIGDTTDHIVSLAERVAELEARILMMATIENNLRGGLKQLDKENARIKSQCGCYQRASEYVLPISEAEL